MPVNFTTKLITVKAVRDLSNELLELTTLGKDDGFDTKILGKISFDVAQRSTVRTSYATVLSNLKKEVAKL